MYDFYDIINNALLNFNQLQGNIFQNICIQTLVNFEHDKAFEEDIQELKNEIIGSNEITPASKKD